LARLYRRRHSGPWWGDYRDGIGSRCRRSTDCTDKGAAMAVLARWLREAEMVRAGLSVPSSARVPTARAVQDWRAALIASKPIEGERPYVVRAVRSVLSVCNAEGWGYLDQITPEAVDRFLARGKGETVRPYLRAFGGWLVESGQVTANPVRRGSAARGRSVPRRALTLAEARALITCPKIPERRRLAYALMLATGLRRGQVARLAPSMLVGDRLHLPALVRVGDRMVRLNKGGRPLVVPLSGVALEAFIRLCEGVDSGACLAPPLSVRSFLADLGRAGIERENERGRVVIHSLRKTANTLAAAAGVDSETRRELFGWSSVRLAEMTYMDGTALPVDRAARVLGELLGGTDAG